MKLWYNKPADKWHEALPVGNGRLGGMIFGKPFSEVIQLNEDSIWSGKPLDRHNPDALKNLPKIRDLVRKGNIREAEKLALLAMSGVPNSQRSYQTAGELYINMNESDSFTDYRRELDLETGIVRVCYKIDGGGIEREVFTSYPDGVMAIHLEANGEKKLNFSCNLGRKHNWTDEVTAKNSNQIQFKVTADKEAISFCTMVQAEQLGGTMKTMGEFLIIEEAKKATLYLSIETSFRYKGYEEACLTRINKAKKKGYELLKRDHIRDHQNLFGRVELSFGKEDNASISTDERIRAVQRGEEDVNLLALHFQYGRYLLIASSREGSLPANLQGIWNDSLTPPWDSKYTININTEMNYWLAECANLSECHIPYFEFLNRVKESGKKTAKKMYGCRGSVAHHNVDIYADTAPQDHYPPASFWVMGEAWLATHIWEHYLYTQDVEFLEKYFDVLEQCILFFYDFLIEGPDGTLVTSPSVSPENTYIMPNGTKGTMCEGATMDNQILTELFNGYIKACSILEKSKEKIRKAKEIFDRIPKMKIGKYGQLMEWMQDYEEDEPGHRHISHLYAVYPGTIFSFKETPELMKAAKITLERRLANGGGHTGWSRAWIIGIWARLHEAEKAYENYNVLLAQGTFPNLMDNHPTNDGFVFQIDGNLGAAAAMVEMLIQSHGKQIVLLPSIPKAMETGMVRGLRIRGGALVNMQWEKGKVIYLEIMPIKDQFINIYINNHKIQMKLEQNKKVVLTEFK